jgi:hypothetical protein
MFLSSTVSVVLLTVVVVPFTVRFPVTTSALFTVVVPVPAPMFRDVAAPAKFTVVAVVLTRANVVALVSSPATVVFPDTVKDESVPMLVRLDVTMLLGSVVPVKELAAIAAIVAWPSTHENRESIDAIAAFSVVPQPVSPDSGSRVDPSIKYVVTVDSVQRYAYL